MLQPWCTRDTIVVSTYLGGDDVIIIRQQAETGREYMLLPESMRDYARRLVASGVAEVVEPRSVAPGYSRNARTACGEVK
jgi:hypothetical protein